MRRRYRLWRVARKFGAPPGVLRRALRAGDPPAYTLARAEVGDLPAEFVKARQATWAARFRERIKDYEE